MGYGTTYKEELDNIITNKHTIPKMTLKDPLFPVPYLKETKQFQDQMLVQQEQETGAHEHMLGFHKLKPGQSTRHPDTNHVLTRGGKYVVTGSVNFRDADNYLGYNHRPGETMWARQKVPDHFGLAKMIGSGQSSTTPFRPNDPYLQFRQKEIGSKSFLFCLISKTLVPVAYQVITKPIDKNQILSKAIMDRAKKHPNITKVDMLNGSIVSNESHVNWPITQTAKVSGNPPLVL